MDQPCSTTTSTSHESSEAERCCSTTTSSSFAMSPPCANESSVKTPTNEVANFHLNNCDDEDEESRVDDGTTTVDESSSRGRDANTETTVTNGVLSEDTSSSDLLLDDDVIDVNATHSTGTTRMESSACSSGLCCSSSPTIAAQRRLRTYSIANPPMPWFGIDVGGTLTKLVYFEPTDQMDFADGGLDPGEPERLSVVRKYLMSRRTYGETGVRDHHLELTEMPINCRSGNIHFINFPTSRVLAFISLVKSKGSVRCFAQLTTTACATGGGAQKFAGDIERDLDLTLHKFDELETLIVGIRYIVDHNPTECYFWENPIDDQLCKQIAYRSNGEDCALQYPYLIVNIGSGVSILAVRGDGNFKRVSGSSIGGGFFAGLCSLLTGCQTFEEAIELATHGQSDKVDKLVRDIYGGDYSFVGLPGDAVAASFGHMICPEKRKLATPADLARAALDTVTNNIGSIALNAARNEDIQRIVFVGNFLRVNPIASRRLAYAMDFWSHGHVKALFLKHEGYFGAVGCLLKLTEVQHIRRQRERDSRSQSHSDSSSNLSGRSSIT